MLHVLILCILLQPAAFMRHDRRYDKEYEKYVTKKPRHYHKLIQQLPDTSFENEKSRYYDSIYDEPPFPKDTRRTRVLKWFKKILLSANPRYSNLEDITREKSEESNMTAILIKLVRALDSLNYNLKCNNKNDYLSFRFPTRQKRESITGTLNNDSDLDHIHNENNVSKSELKQKLRSSNTSPVTENNNYKKELRSSDSSSVPENNSKNNVKNEKVISDTTDLLSDKSDGSNHDFSNRRFIFPPNSRPDVKDQLLEYLENMFANLEYKIRPLTRLKITLSDDNNYRIGYIIANIDTLQIQLQKLKKQMDENKRFWGENKVNELFNKLKVANDVFSNLLDILISYLPAPTYG